MNAPLRENISEALQVFCRNMFQWKGSVDRTFGP